MKKNQEIVLYRQYVSLGSYISDCLCCLNTHMCHKSKYSNDIYLLVVKATADILALLYALKYILNTLKRCYEHLIY